MLSHNFSLGGVRICRSAEARRFGSGWNKATDLVSGGWNVNYFTNAHSGFPVTPTAGSANTGGRTPRGNVRANYYRTLRLIRSQTVDQFFGP